LAAYNPTPISLPDRFAANAFGGTTSFPYTTDPSITIYRSTIAFRKRSDAVILTVDGYGTQIADDDLLAKADLFSSLLSDHFTDNGLLPGPPLVGSPTEWDFTFRVFDGTPIGHYTDVSDPNPDALARTNDLNTGVLHAFNAHWSGTLEEQQREFFMSWRNFLEPADALALGQRFSTGIPESDLANGIVRSALPDLNLVVPNDGKGWGSLFSINPTPEQSLPGRELIIVTGTELLTITEVRPPVPVGGAVPTPTADLAEMERMFQDQVDTFIVPIWNSELLPEPLWGGYRIE
jgi:hypothetical protein